MAPGPLPDPKRQRRNAPTIPTTRLPASGRQGPIPHPPDWVDLGHSGRAWWDWAWRQPQAAGWSDGDLRVVARRAELEDDLTASRGVESLDLLEVSEADGHEVRMIVGRLAGLLQGNLSIHRVMNDLDERLGLTPKGRASLRWEIVDDSADDESEASGDGPPRNAPPRKSARERRRGNLQAV